MAQLLLWLLLTISVLSCVASIKKTIAEWFRNVDISITSCTLTLYVGYVSYLPYDIDKVVFSGVR